LTKFFFLVDLRPLDDNEKSFIIQWVERNPPREHKINWKSLIPVMNKEFGKLRSEDAVKNYWNLTLRKRSKESLKLKAGNEQQQKEVDYEPNITFEYENEKDFRSPPPLFENEENILPPSSNASPIEILCWVAEVKYKRDFSQFTLTSIKQ